MDVDSVLEILSYVALIGGAIALVGALILSMRDPAKAAQFRPLIFLMVLVVGFSAANLFL